MAKILLIHDNLKKLGGGGAVGVYSIEYLQESRHKFDLMTISQVDFDEVNNFYGTDIEGDQISNISLDGIEKWYKMIEYSKKLPSRKIPNFSYIKSTIPNRKVSNVVERKDYDLVLSTKNEWSINQDSIYYIHFPRYKFNKQNSKSIRSIYYDVLNKLMDLNKRTIEQGNFVTNSKWTKNVVEEVYDVTPDVIYPPVSTSDISSKPWADRENGFVSVGRITPDKNILSLIDAICEINKNDVRTHLHIVGGKYTGPSDYEQYYYDVKSRADKFSYIHFEGDLKREKLVKLLASHKYGLHGKKQEHFGIAVAEMVAAGMIPFLHKSGGQVEIVDSDPRVCYHNINDLISKISKVIESENIQTKILDGFPEVNDRYGVKKFKQNIGNMVESLIRKKTTHTPR